MTCLHCKDPSCFESSGINFCYLCLETVRTLDGIKCIPFSQMDSSCGICGQAFSDASVVAINGSKEEMAELARRMAESKLLLKAKQGKKRKLLQLKSSPES